MKMVRVKKRNGLIVAMDTQSKHILMIVLFLLIGACLMPPPWISSSSHISNNKVPSAAGFSVGSNLSVTVAFHVQISEDNAAKVPRLLRAIYHPMNIYALHVDKKCTTAECVSLYTLVWSRYNTNVKFMPETSVTYMGITMVLNTLDAIDYLLEWDQHWTFFINLSGSDYPLLPPEDIQSILTVARDNCARTLGLDARADQTPNFIDFSLNTTNRWATKLVVDLGLVDPDAGLDVHYLNYSGRPTFDISYGSQWMILSRNFSHRILASKMTRYLTAFFATVPASDEHFFHTFAELEMSRGLAGPIVRDNMRTIFWPDDLIVYTPSPLNLDNATRYWPSLYGSGSMFARKFSHNSAMLDVIDDMSRHPVERDRMYKNVLYRLRPCKVDVL
jgi:hypothetical protein